jgi:hypothetical protein
MHGNDKQPTVSLYFSKHIKSTNPIIQAIVSKSEKAHCEREKRKVKDILKHVLKKEKEKLRKICCEGLPDDLPILRSMIWKINLRYLNYEVEKWNDYLLKKRVEYEDIKLAFMMKMEAERKLFKDYETFIINTQGEEKNYKKDEYDLIKQVQQENVNLDEKTNDLQNHFNNSTVNGSFNNLRSKSQTEMELKAFIKCTDKNLLEEIDKDVRRTHTDLNFFFMPSKFEDLLILTNEQIREVVEKRRSNDVKTTDDLYLDLNKTKFETHADVLCRILYIYSKLNPDISYVQGMNELLAPIYFCFSFDSQSFLEADTFWTFTFMMDDLKVLFMKSKDDTREGIFNKMELLNSMIEIVDKEIHEHLIKNNVELSHFSFRWFILFFTQDFILPDVLRLWDTIFSEKDRFYYVFFISLAIIKMKKNKILENDFAGIILTMQNLEDLEVDKILNYVHILKKDYDKKIRKIISKCTK